jgi:hypothetical protein
MMQIMGFGMRGSGGMGLCNTAARGLEEAVV